MGGKRTLIFPSLLLAIFFILVTATGFFLVRIIRTNIENLLKGEGEIVYNYIKREIDINFEYLDLLEKSPAIITPNFLSAMVSDEAVAEELYGLMSEVKNAGFDKIPINNIAIFDLNGKRVFSKGTIQIPPSDLALLLTKKQETVLKIPAGKDQSFFIGARAGVHIIFFDIDHTELGLMRKKSVVADILDREEKRFNIAGISLYDREGNVFEKKGDETAGSLVFSAPLNSVHLPGYTIKIFVSKALANDTIRRTTWSFLFILVLLVLSGGLSVVAIFLLQRKHEKRVTEMEKELEVKERLTSLGKLASGMAHEIRNPLNAMSLSVQRLKREFLPEENKKEEYIAFLDIVRSELVRVDRIVEEFLLSTRAHAPFVNENLQGLLDEITTILGEKAASRTVAITNRADGGVTIECQRDRLKQAFYNIILNAIEAIGQKGAIEISTKTKGDSIDIFIKDTGPGIRGEDIHRIFEHYYTTKDKGMGLGLPISYMIVKDHGGDIRVISAEGEGTTFVITLPCRQPLKKGEG